MSLAECVAWYPSGSAVWTNREIDSHPFPQGFVMSFLEEPDEV